MGARRSDSSRGRTRSSPGEGPRPQAWSSLDRWIHEHRREMERAHRLGRQPASRRLDVEVEALAGSSPAHAGKDVSRVGPRARGVDTQTGGPREDAWRTAELDPSM